MAARYAHARRVTNVTAFADAIEPMLAELADLHVWIELPDGTKRYTHRSTYQANHDHRVVRSQLTDVDSVDGVGVVGRTREGIAVALIQGLPVDADYDRLLDSMTRFANAKAWIVDLRANSGGSESAAAQIAGMFTDRRVKYARSKVRDGKKLREVNARYLEPSDHARIDAPTVVLIGPGCVSSGEGFALMMKAIPGVTLIGRPTRGASGNPRPVTLSNGIRVWFSRWVSMELDGAPIEGRGVRPDETVEHEGTGDPTFSRAVEFLGESP